MVLLCGASKIKWKNVAYFFTLEKVDVRTPRLPRNSPQTPRFHHDLQPEIVKSPPNSANPTAN
jgi:hypothetical protein